MASRLVSCESLEQEIIELESNDTEIGTMGVGLVPISLFFSDQRKTIA